MQESATRPEAGAGSLACRVSTRLEKKSRWKQLEEREEKDRDSRGTVHMNITQEKHVA